MIKKFEDFVNEGRFEEEGQNKLDRARQLSDSEYQEEIKKSQRQAKIISNEKQRQRLIDLVGNVENLSEFVVDLLDALLNKFYALKFKDTEKSEDNQYILDEKIKTFPIKTQDIINNINSIEELKVFLEDISNLYPISGAEKVMQELNVKDSTDLYQKEYNDISK